MLTSAAKTGIGTRARIVDGRAMRRCHRGDAVEEANAVAAAASLKGRASEAGAAAAAALAAELPTGHWTYSIWHCPVEGGWR